jgi:hypothetical protein
MKVCSGVDCGGSCRQLAYRRFGGIPDGSVYSAIAMPPRRRLEPDRSIDDRIRMTRHGVYAAGDVTGRDQFVYMAAYGAGIAAENALNGNGRRYDATATPSIVFTDPQAASVGLTEVQAREQGLAGG